MRTRWRGMLGSTRRVVCQDSCGTENGFRGNGWRGGCREYKNYELGVNTNALGEEFETTLKVLKGLMGDKIGPNDEYMRDAVHNEREKGRGEKEGKRGGKEIEEAK